MSSEQGIVQQQPSMKQGEEVEEDSPLVAQNYQTDQWRFCNLFLFIVMEFFSHSSYFGLSIVAVQTQQLYSLSISSFYWFSCGYLIPGLLLSVPASELIARRGVRFSLLVGVLLYIIGAWLRVLINNSFIYAFIGHYLLGASYTFFLNSVTQVSAHWFGPRERVWSTGAIEFFTNVGFIFSTYSATLVIDVNTIPLNQESYYRNRVYLFYLIQAVVCTIVGPLCWLLYRERPKVQVATSSSRYRLKSWDACKLIVCNRSVVLLLLHMGICISNAFGYSMVMEQGLRKYGVTSHQLGLYSLVTVPVSLGGIILGACLSGGAGKFKLVIVISSLLPIIFLALSLAFKWDDLLYGLVLILFNLNMSILYSVGYEYLAELSFPVSEAFSSGVVNLVVKFGQVVLLQICSQLLKDNNTSAMLLLLTLSQFLGFILIVFVKQNMSRWDLDLADGNQAPTGQIDT